MSIHGSKQVKGFLKRSSAKSVWELFKYSRNQLRTMTGQQTGHCHLKGHSHNWSHMGNFCARSTCIIFYSTPSLTSVFSLLFFVVFLSGVATIFWGPERVFTTAASNRNYGLKKSQFFHILLFGPMLYIWFTRWGSWLRHCATSRKVAGSIPEGVIGIFH